MVAVTAVQQSYDSLKGLSQRGFFVNSLTCWCKSSDGHHLAQLFTLAICYSARTLASHLAMAHALGFAVQAL